ncbi:hypothetical protein Fmac_010618 [Flemingia macrophylla]|uniref:Ion transport domain-containing protein n=1 Tax=Flemingia macrophylla TaxID=520843 RepID=A0ABD1MK43_9FABA
MGERGGRPYIPDLNQPALPDLNHSPPPSHYSYEEELEQSSFVAKLAAEWNADEVIAAATEGEGNTDTTAASTVQEPKIENTIDRFPKCSSSYVGKDLLKYTVISQYGPRLLRIYPLFKEVKSTSEILTETAWAGAAYNLFLYMLASHVVGAFWYLFSVESRLRCWRKQLQNAKFNHKSFLSCGCDNPYVQRLLNSSCPLTDPQDIKDLETFNFGMFIEALKYRVVESTTYFHHKFFYCFWAECLQTSTYVGEIIFAIFIAVFGLVLFASLIGNMKFDLRDQWHTWLFAADLEGQVARLNVAKIVARLLVSQTILQDLGK